MLRTRGSKTVWTKAISAIPIEVWHEANKQATRSTLHTFTTGAIIFDDKGKIIGKGCSHHRDGSFSTNTVHAEQHAIESLHGIYTGLRNMFVLSTGRAGNPAYSSCPCYNCALKLQDNYIHQVFYLERDNSEQWNMRIITPKELMEIAENSRVRSENFARNMRLE